MSKQMTKYEGTKCIVCGEIFKDSDDVVVCPECGTPYHRECWKKENKCVNTALHENGGSWQPNVFADGSAQNDSQVSGEPLRCVRCGTENEPGRMFCGECGMPLVNGRNDERPFNGYDSQSAQNQNPQFNENTGYNPYAQGYNANNPNGFNNPQSGGQFGGRNMYGMPVQQVKLTEESELDGIRLGDFFDYAGRKSLSMIANFVKFAKTKNKISFNFVALFIPEIYFFYRKMKKQGIIFLLLSFILSIPALLYYGQDGSLGMTFYSLPIDFKSNAFAMLTNVCSLLSTLLGVLAGFYANYWYYKQARQDITDIRNSDIPDSCVKKELAKKGGTSWGGVIFSVTLTAVLTLALWLIVGAIF